MAGVEEKTTVHFFTDKEHNLEEAGTLVHLAAELVTEAEEAVAPDHGAAVRSMIHSFQFKFSE